MAGLRTAKVSALQGVEFQVRLTTRDIGQTAFICQRQSEVQYLKQTILCFRTSYGM
jgi:hypothetical protein